MANLVLPEWGQSRHLDSSQDLVPVLVSLLGGLLLLVSNYSRLGGPNLVTVSLYWQGRHRTSDGHGFNCPDVGGLASLSLGQGSPA